MSMACSGCGLAVFPDQEGNFSHDPSLCWHCWYDKHIEANYIHKPEHREPPHCPTCECGVPVEAQSYPTIQALQRVIGGLEIAFAESKLRVRELELSEAGWQATVQIERDRLKKLEAELQDYKKFYRSSWEGEVRERIEKLEAALRAWLELAADCRMEAERERDLTAEAMKK
jgi:hypothetical protein